MNVHLASSTPSIDTKSVYAALKSLVYTTVTSDDSDLYRLALVDDFLNSIQAQPNLQTRRYGLGCVLVNIITQQMVYLAALLGVKTSIEQATYHQTMVTISLYAQTGNAELIGWCWLYCRHVRAELCISPTVFSEACSINERTLRRYQADAMQRLTIVLIEKELQSQIAQPDAAISRRL
jgi:hypothetical protein